MLVAVLGLAVQVAVMVGTQWALQLLELSWSNHSTSQLRRSALAVLLSPGSHLLLSGVKEMICKCVC